MFCRLCWLLLGAVSVCYATSYEADKARLLRLVPPEIDLLTRASQQCQSPGVDFTRADFDGDGSFRYVVASYSAICQGRVASAVRVLKEVDGKLLLHQVLPGLELRAGEILRPQIIDVENNGVSELVFRVWKGTDASKDYSLLLFSWQSGALHPVFTRCPVTNESRLGCALARFDPRGDRSHQRRIDTRNAIFRDLYADGRLELLTPLCSISEGKGTSAPPFPVRDKHETTRALALCPNTRWYFYHSGALGEIKGRRSQAPLSHVAVSDKEFSLSEINTTQGASDAGREFVVQLRRSYDPSKTVAATELRPETLLLGRSLHPLKVVAKSQDQDCKSQQEPTSQSPSPPQCPKGEFLEAQFDRASVAKVLPRLQPGKKLEAGDLVSLPLAALMDNGDYVAASIAVSISITNVTCPSGTCLQESAGGPVSSASSDKSCGEGNCIADGGNDGAQLLPAAATAEPENEIGDSVTLKKAFMNLPGDQKAIWTSPFRVRLHDSVWLAPTLGIAGVLIGSDHHSMQRERSNASAASKSSNISNGGVAAMTALPVFMYAWGSWRGNSKEQETGLLSGEALLNSLAVSQALKLVFARERPTATDGQGRFFTDISNASFPSAHSMLSWTAASVIAHEYPGVASQILVYGTAAAVSISRVASRQHFPSDVVVGSAMGWLIGRQAYKAHHNPELESTNYGSFPRDPREFDASKLGSTFVPLDSWVYPALERLAALGFIKTQFSGLRPWTRRECLREIEEAQYFAQDLPADASVAQTIRMLREEFREDGQSYQSFAIDSIYTGYTSIAGSPLRDSYHFGATIWNDFGRPYDQGGSLYSGASVSAIAGRFFWYARGEYQHAPGRPALSVAQQNLINTLDENTGPPNPVGPAPAALATIDRFYPLDMYAGVKLGEYAVTFGKQTLWLGPGESGPLMLSDNADPMYMLRMSRTTPLLLLGILRHLGEIRGEFIVAKLSGHQFPPRPFFNLQKLSFHPTKNLEIGFTRASLWAGVGHPFTAHSLLRNFTANGDSGPGVSDPGDRKSGLDFSYRLPGLRNWLTLYGDFYSDDDPSPLANPRRAAVNPGVYLSHVPGVSKLDLRVEATSTQALTATDRTGTFLYFNNNYHDSNTNKGLLFGNQTGRDGRTYQAWSTYHFSAVTSLQFSYRDTKASSLFLSFGPGTPSGGTQSDASTRFLWQVRPNWSVDAFIQYERWFIPVLRPTAQQDVTGRLQLTFTPHMRNPVPRKN
jgi:hypothetical protein